MQEINQQLTLTDRRILTVSGVIEIIEYDDEKITLFTTMGDIRIRGAGLQINSAFSDSNSVEIKGNVRALFFGDNKEKYNDNFISRIFR